MFPKFPALLVSAFSLGPGLNGSTIIMCFSPFVNASGGGCRAASVGEWAAEGREKASFLPPLPWGQSFPFLEQASVGDHLELARMGDDRFILCFETAQIVCRLGLVKDESITFGEALLEDSPRLVSVSPGRGTEFAVCTQSKSESQISCRWGQAKTASRDKIEWSTATPMIFAFDGG